jgi:DNA repair protein SbcC/Rad50
MDIEPKNLTLKLQNFRCWENRLISIPSTGIVLISAKSGEGKSSLLNGIYFCLTGGRMKNVSTFGKTSSMVEIAIDGLKIIRPKGSKATNKLTVHKNNKIYEEAEAQEIIDKTFGKEFATVSYIDQMDKNSFIFLSPIDKMKFLENLLLKEYEIDSIKKRLNEEISGTKEEIISEGSKVSTIKDILKSMTKTEQKQLDIGKIIITPLNFQKINEKVISNLEVSEKNLKISYTKLRKLEDDSLLFLKNNEKLKTLDTILEDLEMQKKNIGIDDLNNGFEKINKLDIIKKNYLKYKEYTENIQKLKEKQQKFEEITEKNQSDTETLNKELNALPIFTKTLVELRKIIEYIERMEKLEKRLDDVNYENLIEESNSLLKQKQEELTDKIDRLDIEEQSLKCYKCPACQRQLKLENDSLILFKREDTCGGKEAILALKDDIKKLRKECEKIEKNILDYQIKNNFQIETTIEYNEYFDKIENFYNTSTGLNSKKDILDEIERIEENNKKIQELDQKIKNIQSDSLSKQLTKDISFLEERLANMCISPKNDQCISEEDFLKATEEYVIVKGDITRYEKILKNIEKVNKEYKDLEINKTQDKDYDNLISCEKNKCENYTAKVEEYKKNLSSLDMWKKIYDGNEKYDKLFDDSLLSESNIEKLNERLRVLLKLRDHVKNAERKSILDFVDSLNTQASIYIEEFFKDQDITVELKTISETKIGKENISLNFDVNYKGMNGDLSFLSGGERDRVNLAFTLALSELVNSRILMLDECISSLDADTANTVIETLKERYKGKLIICVAHNCEKGMFDHVLEL